ncbi:MAG TPA: Rieske 2Fe-2S domain-containing protein [Bacteroidia bacterium]|nr:Rieske 2Fe-2S domain-containing protein [Bacteroidia bacterium]
MAYHWIKVFGSELEMENQMQPGSILSLRIRNENICLVRNEKGCFAFNDKCPHNGASLSRGTCTESNEVVCPLHRYSFNLQSGRATSGGAFSLLTYPIEIKPEGVFIGFKASWWEL